MHPDGLGLHATVLNSDIVRLCTLLVESDLVSLRVNGAILLQVSVQSCVCVYVNNYIYIYGNFHKHFPVLIIS